VNAQVASARGTVDSVESNPEQILANAKAQLRSSAVNDELEQRKAAIAAAKAAKGATSGGLLIEVAATAAVLVAVGAAVSSSFREILARAWNVFLGIFGRGVRKLETPEIMAQRIIDELNAQKPVYNRKVQEASTLVEKMKLQIQGDTAKIAELETNITAILSDSDPNNDHMAAGWIGQQKILQSSIDATKDQLTHAEEALAGIKESRARFFGEREEMLAKVQAGLTQAASAKIQKEIAELKGGFTVNDLKGKLDTFNSAVNDQVASARGTVDSVESNPDQILANAKAAMKTSAVSDEIEKRKAAIAAAKAAKGQTAGALGQGQALGLFTKVLGVAFALIAPMLSTLVFAVSGGVALIASPEQGRWIGAQLGIIGAATLVIGLAGAVFGSHLGLAYGAFGAGIRFAVPAFVALAAGVIATARAHKSDATVAASVAATPAGASIVAPSAETRPAAPSAGASFSLQPLWNALARLCNAFLGALGFAVKKAETPEILAQRIVDQLNGAKPEYNNKVAQASTLVERLRQQIATESAKVAELETTITAILSDNDVSNDHMAAGLIGQQKILEASIAASKDQLGHAEESLAGIKESRSRFFGEREETLAKVNASLTQVKSAEIQKQMAELKGGFKIGDLGDNVARFQGAVNERVAAAKGTVDSVESNPEQILANAKASLKSSAVQDELAKRKAAIAAAKGDKGAVSGSFGDLLSRAANATLGALSLGVKKAETPQVMAQRIIDELNAQKPVYNRNVQNASTLVEKLRLQVEGQENKSKELDESVTALLSDSDAANDSMAEPLLAQKATLDASIAENKAQVTAAEQALAGIKAERDRFFGEREEMLAKVQAGLTQAETASVQKQIAELKGGFKVEDLGSNLDRFQQAVNAQVASARGTVDSVESNPEQILANAKAQLRSSAVNDELEKRKAAIAAAKAAKGAASGAIQSPWRTMFKLAIGGLVGSGVVGLLSTYFGPVMGTAIFVSLLTTVAIPVAMANRMALYKMVTVFSVLGGLNTASTAILLGPLFGITYGFLAAFGVTVLIAVAALAERLSTPTPAQPTRK
jgi:phage shock protein A